MRRRGPDEDAAGSALGVVLALSALADAAAAAGGDVVRAPGVHNSPCNRQCAMVGLAVGLPLVCICKVCLVIYFLRERRQQSAAEAAERRLRKKQKKQQREAGSPKADYHAMQDKDSSADLLGGTASKPLLGDKKPDASPRLGDPSAPAKPNPLLGGGGDDDDDFRHDV
eukprot:TRINITY_DN25702_c0_g1_i1.p2 TRINITY_DN25702_c0_g1~~TRINITY_DN25702_c0_g1_i1.p2  ORF type:complete len:194 (+),score=86.95 TRINITY_DN25702_c0_g1_i1:77-583(+)